MLMAALLGSACSVVGGHAERQPPPEPELDTLRIGVTDSIDAVCLRLGVAQGLFARRGVDVEMVEHATRSGALDALEDGDVDLALADNVSVLTGAAEGVRYEFQGEAYLAGAATMALMTMPGAGEDGETEDEDPVEPEGRIPMHQPRIGVGPDADLGRLATHSLLATEGIEHDEITFVEDDFAGLMRALAGTELDAVWLEEPRINTAQREYGATVLADAARGPMRDFPVSSYVTTSDTAEAYPETFALFRSLLERSQALGSDPTLIRGSLPDFTSIDATAAALVALGSFPTVLNTGRLQRVADLMHATGMLDEQLDVAAMVPGDE
ncbi:ABC transporter substrate-binding protein [Haloechinothrix sp. LS1_15]|uniref:ABC transporter substrate-binding protein n=1 Tax=Haloechinothrix sp. LS1_15 TaxID=2652248 RepID=UPI00294B175A|nr:ABC transporter substrate-binding protein [Haloechinothrix sp. LS1_15]